MEVILITIPDLEQHPRTGQSKNYGMAPNA
jgi:hypothetical protein